MIREALARKRVVVTGATGFLGTAMVERLLRSVPDCEVVVLVRPGRRGATERVRREVLANDAFDRLRAEGRIDEVASRLRAAAGDVSVDGLGLDEAGRALVASADVVVHSAATVNFESPLDAAVEVNVLGPARVARVLAESGSSAHLVAVSTAYVAGSRRGEAPEALLADTPFSTRVDWRAEVDAARRTRADVDAASRQPKRLDGFVRQARGELGAAGTPLLAARAERLRERWLADEMVEVGRARARGLGWPDVYAYTKAMGEEALMDGRGDVRVSIVRPSIIESALAEPKPGWIRGFRMAEPVIISYGRGLIRDFPGIPEGVCDVIPVDFVVAAIMAVAAAGPPNGATPVYHAATGWVNPLPYGRMVDLVREWFLEHPLYDAEGQPVVVSTFSFPSRGKVRSQLKRGVSMLAAAERGLSALPGRGRTAELSSRLEERRSQAERALGYVELYGTYAETEAVFRVERLLRLWESLDEEDRAAFAFDPALIEWRSYFHDVHLPSVVEHSRVRTAPSRRTAPRRSDRQLAAILSPARHLAVFDLENTLLASNVVESYAWLATRQLAPAERARFTLRLLREAPGLLTLDRRDRGDFLRHFYRRYEGAPARRLRGDAGELYNHLLLNKVFPDGIRRVREHQALGHRTMLITGALDFMVEPLRPLFDEVVCARMGEEHGVFTGQLVETPLTGEARALALARYTDAEGLSMAECVAYADSSSDLPLLEAVGHPVAVNPDAKLAATARKRGWHVEQWARAPGAPRPLLPLAPRSRSGA